VAKTITYLENKIDDSLVQDDLFAMAIIAYALQLADSPRKDDALSILEEMKNTDGRD
jgi:CD109 antigen